jgi:hypothetical protein
MNRGPRKIVISIAAMPASDLDQERSRRLVGVHLPHLFHELCRWRANRDHQESGRRTRDVECVRDAARQSGDRARAETEKLFTRAWAGLSLHTPSFSTSPYTHVEFLMHQGGSTPSGMAASLYNASGQLIQAVNITPHASPAGNGWHRVSIPLSALGGVNTTITRFQLQDTTGGSQSTFYVDDINTFWAVVIGLVLAAAIHFLT